MKTVSQQNPHPTEQTDLRPFYFNLVLWGERYRYYFLNYCLPSLLSPRNIPALINGRKNKFLICTPREDWEHLQSEPMFLEMAKYIEPVLVEIPPPKDGVSNCIHMGIGHKIATEMTFRNKAYGIALTPDLLVSDGSIEAVQKRALEGKHIVFTAALRFAEEPLFEELEKLGLINGNGGNSSSVEPLTATGRDLVKAGLKSFHSETMRYEWDAPYFTDFPVACFWRVRGGDGIVLYSFSWAPFLLDYGIVQDHSTETFDEWTFDGDYVYKNFSKANDIHVVQDSDEIMLVSWAPWKDKELSLKPQLRNTIPFVSRLNRGIVLSEIYNSSIMDPLKRRIFHCPVYWHAGPVTRKYERKMKETLKLVQFYACESGKIPGTKTYDGSNVAANYKSFSNNAVFFYKSMVGFCFRFLKWLFRRSVFLLLKTMVFIRKASFHFNMYRHYLSFLISDLKILRERFRLVLSAFRGDREAITRVNHMLKVLGLSKYMAFGRAPIKAAKNLNENDLALWRTILYSGALQKIPNNTMHFRMYGIKAEPLISADIRLNNMGWFSKYDYCNEKRKGEFRICILGGAQCASTVTSFSWPDLLQSELEKRCPDQRVSVYNFSWPHDTLDDYLPRWRDEVLWFHPDVVLVFFSEADLCDKYESFEPTYKGHDLVHGQTIEKVIGGVEFKLNVSVTRNNKEPLSLKNPNVIAPRPYAVSASPDVLDNQEIIARLQEEIVSEQIEGYAVKKGKKTGIAESEVAMARNFDPPVSIIIGRSDGLNSATKIVDLLRKEIPNVLIIYGLEPGNPYGEHKKAQKMHEKLPSLKIIEMKDYLPAERETVDVQSWFLAPHIGNSLSEKGHGVYAKIVADMLERQDIVSKTRSQDVFFTREGDEFD